MTTIQREPRRKNEKTVDTGKDGREKQRTHELSVAEQLSWATAVSEPCNEAQQIGLYMYVCNVSWLITFNIRKNQTELEIITTS